MILGLLFNIDCIIMNLIWIIEDLVHLIAIAVVAIAAYRLYHHLIKRVKDR